MTLKGAAAAKRERLGGGVESVAAALFRLSQQGLVRLSPTTLSELGALVQTAHNASMIKVERELEVLQTHVRRYIDRDPLFRRDALLDALNRVWLLNRRARAAFDTGRDLRELGEFLGVARRTYHPVDEPVVLQALGASGWVTDSDFVGITVYMRRLDTGALVQVSTTRPVAYFGNEPARLLRVGLSEYVDLTLSELSHGAFTFHNAKLSDDGRMSIHSGLDVGKAAWRGASAYADCTANTWDALAGLLRGVSLDPVSSSASRLVLLEGRLSGVHIDERAQTACGVLTDAAGAELAVRVPLRPENNLLVDNLETLARRSEKAPPAWFGRASGLGGLTFMPMTAVYGRPVKLRGRQDRMVNEIHLTLEDVDRVSV